MKIKIREVVSELLTVDPKTRDDDVYLYECVLRVLWVSWPIYYVLSTVDYQTVIRQRRYLQAQYEDLRGSKYKERQKHCVVKRKEYSPSFWDKIQLMFG
jgi:hypothetical protein